MNENKQELIKNGAAESERVYNNIHECIKNEQDIHVINALTIIMGEQLFEFCKLNHKNKKLSQDNFFDKVLCDLSSRIINSYEAKRKKNDDTVH